MIKVLDLFSGIGGLSLGLERTGGFKTIAFCEIDNYCQRVLHKHWPNVYIHSDIRTLTKEQFNGYERPDLVCGGFPCQDISIAGRQVGIGGERSGLWFEMLRVIRELRPTWLLIENVPNLRTKGADIVFAGLEEADYAWASVVVGAWAVGAPHRRNRVWILATLNNSERRQGERTETIHRESAFSWCKDVRSVSDLLRRPDIPQPLIRGACDGIPNYVDRDNALGNSVVPQIPELFGRFILRVADELQ